MKKMVFVLLILLIVTVTVFAGDTATGYWAIEKSNQLVVWEIYLEDGLLYGRFVYIGSQLVKQETKAVYCKAAYEGFPISGNVNELPVLKTPWIWGLKPEKEGVWTDGSIINIEDGKRYKCKITFHAADGKKFKSDQLEMRGEVGMGIGKSEYWRRATNEEMALRNKEL